MKKIFKKKWRRKDIIFLLERIELYVSAGLSINKTLEIASQDGRIWQRECLIKLKTSIESGSSLSKGLVSLMNMPKTAAGMIEHGESSGRLQDALAAARMLMEREEELKSKCISAAIYPLMIGLFAAVLTIGLVRGVMPQIIPMLLGLHVQLPFLTRMLIKLSNCLVDYGLYILFGSGVVIFLFVIFYRRSLPARKAIQFTILRVPLLGALLKNYSLSVFLGSFGSLIGSGLPIVSAYERTATGISLAGLKEQLLAESGRISNGVSLGNVLSGKKIPPFIISLLNAGEASGTLGASAVRAAAILDRNIENSLKKMTSLIEPAMMIGIGGIVGAIALSIMMPIYDISKVLQR